MVPRRGLEGTGATFYPTGTKKGTKVTFGREALVRGALVMVALDPTIGHEQRGVRPCVVVSDPDVIGGQRFPLVCVVPVTGTPGEGLLYPPLSPGPSGLAKKSFGLIDHLRSVDKRRIRRVYGTLAGEEIAAIDEGLAVFLGLSGRLDGQVVPAVQ
jgi:mRNA interferase MazF